MGKVVIIGAGASSLVAAIYIARKGKEVLVLERNNKPLKKLLMTGNGRCNYFNDDRSLSHYHSSNPAEVEKIITPQNQEEILSFFDQIGIVPKIKNQYYYPFSLKSTSMKEALLTEAKLEGVQIVEDFFVEEIRKDAKNFYINPKKENIRADFVILATGSKAAPKTGSDGIGYKLASSLGHSVLPVYPALCPLVGDASYLKEWDGIRVEARVSLYIDGKKVKEEEGEVQLTKVGLSGICVFNLSYLVSSSLDYHQKVVVAIDFMPFLKKSCKAFFKERSEKMKGRTLESLLEGFLPYKLLHILLKEAHLSKEMEWNDLTEKQREELFTKLTHFTVSIKGTDSFEKAQVCTGGIPLNEIHSHTMESLKTRNLYLIGELLDVDGDCGGYNLSFAFISGMIAGKSIGEKND